MIDEAHKIPFLFWFQGAEVLVLNLPKLSQSENSAISDLPVRKL